MDVGRRQLHRVQPGGERRRERRLDGGRQLAGLRGRRPEARHVRPGTPRRHRRRAAVPDALSFRDAGGTTLATASVPNTNGWGSYQSVHVPVSLAAGDQTVRLFCETGGFNIDYFRLS
ncbi:carbohydrate-binding protein [Streptomyces sp. NPDC088354]|uniref:carbohydrate-binding protein n=1 Tax=Streptomyces sp. NPDC088354 TaxID=3365856 RepID=UPI003817570C